MPVIESLSTDKYVGEMAYSDAEKRSNFFVTI